MSSFEEVLEVFGRKVDCEELSVDGGVASFSVGELLAVEGQWR